MTRINAITTPEGKTSELYNAITEQMGMVPNIFKSFAHSPAALEGLLGLTNALGQGELEPSLRDQIALTVAGMNGCDYCASAHTILGKGAGVAEDELSKNLHGQSSDTKTQAVLTFANQVVTNRGKISDGELQAVRDAGFTEGQVVEIISHVALNIFTNYFNNIANTEIDFPVVSTDNAFQSA